MSTPPESNYPVGYRKPPRHTQFRKGRSGNPAGRPKGSLNLATALEKALSEQVLVTENGQRHTLSKLEAMIKQMVNKAIAGDARARQQLLGVMHVMEAEPPPVTTATPETTLREADQPVVDQILERMRRSMQEGSDDAAR